MKLKHCPNFSMVAYRKVATDWIMVRLRCKSWKCEYCAEQNRQLWRSFLGAKLEKLNLEWWFGTITAPSWLRTPELSLQAIRNNFDRFMKRLKRVFGKVQYVRIYEKHEKGAYHLHIIISGLSERVERYKSRAGCTAFRAVRDSRTEATWSLSTWWKKTLAKCGCGYIADIKQIPTYAAVKYVTKYMTKSAQDFEQANLRRIQTSRAIGTPKPERIEIWAVSGAIWGIDINWQPFVDADNKKRIPASYWKDHVTYPDK